MPGQVSPKEAFVELSKQDGTIPLPLESDDFGVGAFDCLRGGLATFCLGAFCGWSLVYLTARRIGVGAVRHGGDSAVGLAGLSVVCPGLAATLTRVDVRNYYRMQRHPVRDVLCGFCCTPCVNCQTYNEVKERGGYQY